MYIINLESKICPKFENAFWNSFFASIGWFYFRTHSVVQTNKWKKCFTNVIFVCVNLVRASFALAVLDTSLVYFLNKIFDKQSLPSPSTCYPRPCCLTLKLDNHLYYQHVMPAWTKMSRNQIYISYSTCLNLKTPLSHSYFILLKPLL